MFNVIFQPIGSLIQSPKIFSTAAITWKFPLQYEAKKNINPKVKWGKNQENNRPLEKVEGKVQEENLKGRKAEAKRKGHPVGMRSRRTHVGRQKNMG